MKKLDSGYDDSGHNANYGFTIWHGDAKSKLDDINHTIVKVA